MTSSPTRRDAARQALAVASVGAGAIHLALGPAHMSEWAVLGYGFLAAGALQVLWGARLLRGESPALLRLGGFGTLLLVGVWLVSRTTGLPVGPDAGVAQASGLADQLCVALETVVALGALTLLRRPSAGRAPAGRVAVRGVLAGASLIVLATTGAALASPSHSHDLPKDCPTSIVSYGVDANANGVDDGVERYFACELKRAHEGHEGPEGTDHHDGQESYAP